MPLHILLVFIHVGWVVISYVMLLLVKSCYDWMVPTLPVPLYHLIGSCVIVFGRFGRLIQYGWRWAWWGQGMVRVIITVGNYRQISRAGSGGRKTY